MGHHHRPLVGWYAAGSVLGIPAFLVVGKIFIWGLPLLTAGMNHL